MWIPSALKSPLNITRLEVFPCVPCIAENASFSTCVSLKRNEKDLYPDTNALRAHVFIANKVFADMPQMCIHNVSHNLFN